MAVAGTLHGRGARLGRYPLGPPPGTCVPPLRRGRSSDLARDVTLGYLTGGVLITLALPRRGHRQICAVLRCPLGFAAWLIFTLHLWFPRLDPIARLARLITRYLIRRTP